MFIMNIMLDRTRKVKMLSGKHLDNILTGKHNVSNPIMEDLP